MTTTYDGNLTECALGHYTTLSGMIYKVYNLGINMIARFGLQFWMG